MIYSPQLFSKYLGETEKRIRDIFSQARTLSPCILFFDEVDVLGAKRDWSIGSSNGGSGVHERVLSQLLNEMDGIQDKREVFVIACTSRIDRIDDALLRPGRFDQLVQIDLPTAEDRTELFKWFSRRTPLTPFVNLQEWTVLTEHFTGAAIDMLFREAALHALHENLHSTVVDQRHLQAAFREMRHKKTLNCFT